MWPQTMRRAPEPASQAARVKAALDPPQPVTARVFPMISREMVTGWRASWSAVSLSATNSTRVWAGSAARAER